MEYTLLPSKAPKLILDPKRLRYLVIAPPKWGKTTFFSGVPNACLLAFESGYASAECPIIVINAWDRPYKEKKEGWSEDESGVVYTSAMEALAELEKNNPYDFIIIDTIDQATKICSDYHCELAKVNHPSEGGDFGRGWDILQTSPMRRFYNRLSKLGCGIAAITHAKERTEKDKFNKDRFRRETSLPSAIQQFVHAQSDLIMHGFFGRRREGMKDRDRYISFDGTDELMAGTRIRQVYIPNKYIVRPPSLEDLSLPWKQWTSFFTNNPEAGKLAEKEFVVKSKRTDDESENIESKKEKVSYDNSEEKVRTVAGAANATTKASTVVRK